MGKVTTLYIPDSKAEVWKNFKQVAEREKGKRGASEMLLEIIEKYVQAHGAGNPTYSLDEHLKAGFSPYPTPWAPIGTKELEPFDEREEAEMIKKLDSARASIEVDRRQKHDKRYLERTGGKYSTRTATTAESR